MQVTIIGGGSYQWAPTLIVDLLRTESIRPLRLVLEDIDPAPLPTMEAFARLAASKLGTEVDVTTTTDQRRSLEGADFVIVTISTGGFDSMSVDLDVPARHGISQSVGDTVGPGGINRALRNIPVLVEIGKDMEETCPEAWMLNITNPMTCLTRSVCRETSIKTVGLCHEVGNFCLDLAIAWGMPHENMRPTVTGVNHFPVVTALDANGTDGLERLAQMAERVGGWAQIAPPGVSPAGPDGAESEGAIGSARSEAEPFSELDFARRHYLKLWLFEHFGALPAAGDRHLAEFVPSILTNESGFGKAWDVGLTSIETRKEHQKEYVANVTSMLAGERDVPTWSSDELVAPAIDSLVTGTRRELPLNLPNTGQCPDLPANAVVESICVVDSEGMRGRDAARVPAPLAELLRRHVATQELTVEAALTGDPRLVHAAFELDPLAGRGDLRETQQMIAELLAGTARWLPTRITDHIAEPVRS
jgi:alpha-galactosidase/6-phospho-beta-glucosidase family protein